MEASLRSPAAGAPDDGVSTFINARSRLLAVASRRLGDSAEAEDVVQDVWLRWQSVDRDLVRNPPAFLATATRRLAINRATEARARHEMSWEHPLAEPVDPRAGPGVVTERAQELEAGLRLLLERLSPTERAAYLLREAFDYSYRHIARVVRASEANSRQLVTRARKHLAEERRLPVDASDLRRIVRAFIEATRRGDLAPFEAILRADIADSQSSADYRRHALAKGVVARVPRATERAA